MRTIATARILMPKAMVRLSAGRATMSVSDQAMCFMAGANSIFFGERLLTASNPTAGADDELFRAMGLPSPADCNHETSPALVRPSC